MTVPHSDYIYANIAIMTPRGIPKKGMVYGVLPHGWSGKELKPW